MKYKEARRELKHGQPIRRQSWPSGQRLVLVVTDKEDKKEEGIFLDRNGDLGPYAPTPGDGGSDGSDYRSEDERAEDWIVEG